MSSVGGACSSSAACRASSASVAACHVASPASGRSPLPPPKPSLPKRRRRFSSCASGSLTMRAVLPVSAWREAVGAARLVVAFTIASTLRGPSLDLHATKAGAGARFSLGAVSLARGGGSAVWRVRGAGYGLVRFAADSHPSAWRSLYEALRSCSLVARCAGPLALVLRGALRGCAWRSPSEALQRPYPVGLGLRRWVW